MSESTKDEDAAFIVGLVLGIIVAIVAVVTACQFQWNAWELEAVAKGKAEYVMDPKTGTSTWRWKE